MHITAGPTRPAVASEINEIMDKKFRYNVVPSGPSKVSARIAFQGEVKPADLFAAAAAESGLTAEQVTAATTAVFRQIIFAAQNSQRVRRLAGLFSFTPRCGGVHPDADFQPTAANMNLAIHSTLAPEGTALLEDGIVFQREEVKGEKVPDIDRVFDGATRLLNRCTPGGAFRISGHDFGMEADGSDAGLGVFLTPAAGGAPVRIGSYSDWTETEIMGSWPGGLIGAQNLSIVAKYATGGTHRIGVYGTPLMP